MHEICVTFREMSRYQYTLVFRKHGKQDKVDTSVSSNGRTLLEGRIEGGSTA